LIGRKIIKIVAIRRHILKLKCASVPPDPLAGFTGSYVKERDSKGAEDRGEEWVMEGRVEE